MNAYIDKEFYKDNNNNYALFVDHKRLINFGHYSAVINDNKKFILKFK